MFPSGTLAKLRDPALVLILWIPHENASVSYGQSGDFGKSAQIQPDDVETDSFLN
jgi:hypothetical protein